MTPTRRAFDHARGGIALAFALVSALVGLSRTVGAAALASEVASDPAIEGAESHVYREGESGALRLFVFEPEATEEDLATSSRKEKRRSRQREKDRARLNDSRPAIVFFFGGEWREGSIQQLAPQARYLSTRGMVSVLADYRVRVRNGTTPHDAVQDAKSVIRWLRAHSGELSIDSNRIAAAGAASGAHLAACAALVEGTNHIDDDLSIRASPDVLFLLSPPLDLDGYRTGPLALLDNALAISPLHHIRPGSPPAVIFHGTADRQVPYEQAVDFVHRMKEAGNRAELMGFKDRPHRFWERGYAEGRDFALTLEAIDRFLVALGWIVGTPSVREHFGIPAP